MTNPNPSPKNRFSKYNQPKKKGKQKGYVHAKTILKKFLSVKLDRKNPFTGVLEKMTVAELLHLKQIANALDGDLQSYKEIMTRTEEEVSKQIEISVKPKIQLSDFFGFDDYEDAKDSSK